MPTKIGFALLTHDKPEQALRLVTRLNFLFDHPQIAWHHDFSRCGLPGNSALVRENLTIVQPFTRTYWATFSLVEATLTALATLLSSKAPPDWIIFLSGSDYPIKTREQVERDLSASEFDVHINHKSITWENYSDDMRPGQPGDVGFGVGVKVAHYYDRYCGLRFRVPFVNRRLRPTMRPFILKYPKIETHFTPFSMDFRCYAGEQWFCVRRAAAEYLIAYHRTNNALSSHLKKRDKCLIVPDECYYHTIWCNARHLRVANENWRFADWSKRSRHPKTLVMEDVPRLKQTSAHFARKFDIAAGEEVLNCLDGLTAPRGLRCSAP